MFKDFFFLAPFFVLIKADISVGKAWINSFLSCFLVTFWEVFLMPLLVFIW